MLHNIINIKLLFQMNIIIPEYLPVADGEKEKTISAISAKVVPWIQSTLMHCASGLRRPDSERIIAWCNCVTAGVLSAGKTEFAVNTITSMAHSNPRQFIAVVVLPNRSGDLRLPTKFLDVVSLLHFLFSVTTAMFLFSVTVFNMFNRGASSIP